MNNIFGVKLYYKTLLFRRGCKLAINVTYRCSLNCSYCGLALQTGQRPQSKESTLEEWKQFIDMFTTTTKVREVMVSGGEPTLIKWLPDFVNWLVSEKGLHVTVLTHFRSIVPLIEIKPHYRLQITATYHHQDDLIRFMAVYKGLVDAGHRVNVDEINTGEKDWKQAIEFSRVKRGWNTAQDVIDVDNADPQFLTTPDRMIYLACYLACLDKGRE
jgi:hypothetical protein